MDPLAITVDCWDTLLRRVRAADCVKLATCALLTTKARSRGRSLDPMTVLALRLSHERELAREASRKGGDPGFRIEDAIRRTIWSVMPDVLDEAGVVDCLVDAEIGHEISASYLDPGIMRALSRYAGLRMLVVSDFHIGAEGLCRILRSSGLWLTRDEIIVSCDHMRTKASGRLFDVAADQLGISPHRILHMGDNPVSDVRMARRHGFMAVRYRVGNEDRARDLLNRRFVDRRNGVPPEMPPVVPFEQDDPMSAEGRRAASLFAAFALWLLDLAADKRVGSLVFLAREGRFLKAVVDKVAAADKEFEDRALPSTSVLEISRSAVFLASLPSPDIAAIREHWPVSRPMSMASLVQAIDLPEQAVRDDIMMSAGFGYEDCLPDFLNDGRVVSVFAGPKMRSLLERRWTLARSLAAAYLCDQGLDRPGCMVVDIGWRGSMQDAIGRIVSGNPIDGAYLGLLEMRCRPVSGHSKSGFLFDRNMDPATGPFDLASGIAPLEMLCGAREPSVVRLCRDQNGGVVPCFGEDRRDPGHFDRFIQPFQDGVMEAVSGLVRFMRAESFSGAERHGVALRAASGIVKTPSRHVAEAYCAYAHDEVFDQGRWLTPCRLGVKDILLAPVLPGARRVLRSKLDNSGWRVGILKASANGVPLAAVRALGALDDGIPRRILARLGASGVR